MTTRASRPVVAGGLVLAALYLATAALTGPARRAGAALLVAVLAGVVLFRRGRAGERRRRR